jgi:hypothetical protein
MPTAKKRAPKNSDIHDLLKIHIESWARLSELIQLCMRRGRASNPKIARKTFEHAEQLRSEIAALEEMVRPRKQKGVG